ncbi:MAG: cytochrome c biogenesis protein CcsA [Gammaproteobacteria bacterium]|nr:cytochrome c biogenesis protein CcsA [Gammaproteobacteria bacterium]
MMSLIIGLSAILLYLLSAWTQNNAAAHPTSNRGYAFSLLAWLLQGAHLYLHLFTQAGLLLDVGAALSLTAWAVIGVILISSIRKPVSGLLVFAAPIAAVAIAVDAISVPAFIGRQFTPGILVHITTSILSYALFAVAACQAVLLIYQNRHLKQHQSSRFVASLPPLQTMESLLFEVLAVGQALLTVALVTGFLFLDDLFAQHVIHKTILSLVAWIIFSILLWGHYRLGWRGRTAIRWTLWGFANLVLAFFGTKLVLEFLL